MGSPGVIDQNWLNQAASAQAAQQAQAAAATNANPKYLAGATFNNPNQQQSAWTGVSSAEDPYGVHGVGYDLGKVPGQYDNTGQPASTLSRDELLRAGGYGGSTSFLTGALPDSMKFSGFSKYENQNATQSDPFTGGPSTSAWASQQGGVSQGNLAAQAAQTNSTDPSTGGYPAYPNSYGIGNSTGLGGASAASPIQTPSSYSQNGVTVNVPDASSRGMSPWSMLGESNARDSSKGVMSPQSGGF